MTDEGNIVYRLLVALIATALVFVAMAVPAEASRGPFTNFSQAAGDQYDDDDRCPDDDDDDDERGDRRGRNDDDRGDRRRGRDRDRGDDRCADDEDDDRPRRPRDRDDDDDCPGDDDDRGNDDRGNDDRGNDGRDDDDRDDICPDDDNDRDEENDRRDARGGGGGASGVAGLLERSGGGGEAPSVAGLRTATGNQIADAQHNPSDEVGAALPTSAGPAVRWTLNAEAARPGVVPVIVFLSPTDPVILAGVNAVFRSLGTTQTEVLNLVEPLSVARLRTAAGAEFGSLTRKNLALITRLGRKIGAQIPHRNVLFEAIGPVTFTGILPQRERRYVVFARTGQRLTGQERKVRNAFEKGLAKGVRLTKVPFAGTEAVDSQPSQIGWFKRHRISSVDNVNTLNGQRALRAILLGKARGHFGVKATASRLLPKSVAFNPAAATINTAEGEFSPGVGTSLIITLFGAFVLWTTLRVVSRARGSRR